MREMTAALLACAGAAPAVACVAPETPTTRSGVAVSFALDNDLFNNGDDRDYTNGALFSVTTPDLAPPCKFTDSFPYFRGYTLIGDLSGTQAIYTPRDLRAEPPNRTDRPYAGVLLGNLSVIGVSPTEKGLSYLTFSLGVAGPDSLAGQTQKYVHGAIGAVTPQGWDHQVSDRVVAGVRYQHTTIIERYLDRRRLWSVALEPDVAAEVGNVRTEGSVGALVRFGWNAPFDLGVPRIQNATPGSGYFKYGHYGDGEISRPHAGVYVFGGVHQHAIGYDVALDAPPVNNGPGVNKHNWVQDGQAGVVLAVWGLRLSYTHEFISKEFYGQDHADGYGAVSLSVNFGRDEWPR